MAKTYKYDYLIAGAGFSGAVCARELADAGASVLLVDKRNHIGGNAYDVMDRHGVLIHPYGPHIFHTNSREIFKYLSQFTEWRFYEHRVLAHAEGRQFPVPINRTTLNQVYGLNLQTDDDARAFLDSIREPRETLRTSEDVVLNSVGHKLCDMFFRGYTRKQWGLDLSELSSGVTSRIPTRTNIDDRYFTDQYQFMPLHGYTSMFQRMLDHPAIEVRLSIDYDSIERNTWDHLIYTGPIDAFFNYCFGKLPYRSLSFEHEHIDDNAAFQPVGTVNYPNDHSYTRITEFKHLTGQKHAGTSIVREYPQSDGDPFYPVPNPENEALFKKYEALTEKCRDKVSFVGRLAQYRYYNMDQVVGAALSCSKRLISRHAGVGA